MTVYVRCRDCKQDMAPGNGCTLPQVRIQGQVYDRIRYGNEEEDWGAANGYPCHDCNVSPGQLHHLGCDVERCPACSHQLISCGCDENLVPMP